MTSPVLRKKLLLSDLMPLNGQSNPSRPEDLFSTTSRVGQKYECIWPNESEVGGEVPYIVIPADNDVETFFADIATYYPSYSPITAYSYVLSPDLYARLKPHWDAPESSKKQTWSNWHSRLWIAMIAAEALTGAYTAGGSESSVSYSLCRRSLSFALARATFLYPDFDKEEIARKWVQLRELTHMETSSTLSDSLSWIALLMDEGKASLSRESASDLRAEIKNLISKSITLGDFAKTLDILYPKLAHIRVGLSGHYDGRVSAFELVVQTIARNGRENETDALAIAFFANSIFPGSFAHTKLLSRRLDDYPSILIWYGLFAALSAEFEPLQLFSGLGSKLLRDIRAKFNISERAIADLAYDELRVLSRIGFKAHTIKPTQNRSVLVSLLPGIEIYARFAAAGEPGQELNEASVEQITNRHADTNKRLRNLLEQAQSLLRQDPISQVEDASSTERNARKYRASGKKWERS